MGALAEAGLHWSGLRSAVMIEFTREPFGGENKCEPSTEWRYYVSSLRADAANFNAKVRAHWGIENGYHWVLNVTFNEDDRRIRRGDGVQDFAMLRRITLNLIKHEKSDKVSVCLKRLKTEWSINYLQELLGSQPL